MKAQEYSLTGSMLQGLRRSITSYGYLVREQYRISFLATIGVGQSSQSNEDRHLAISLGTHRQGKERLWIIGSVGKGLLVAPGQ